MSPARAKSDVTGFAGFDPDAMRFFVELAENQNKGWMTANKARYEQMVRDPLARLVEELTARFEADSIPLRGDPKRALFRINRDVRFSADKRPYNDHASAALTRDGNKQSAGVLYLQFAPSQSFAAAGFFRPDSSLLHRLRQGLASDLKGWAEMKACLANAGLSLGRDDVLVRLPRGFEDASPAVADDLKLKSWTVMKPVSPAEMSSKALDDLLFEFGQSSLCLLEFGWRSVDAGSSGLA